MRDKFYYNTIVTEDSNNHIVLALIHKVNYIYSKEIELSLNDRLSGIIEDKKRDLLVNPLIEQIKELEAESRRKEILNTPMTCVSGEESKNWWEFWK